MMLYDETKEVSAFIAAPMKATATLSLTKAAEAVREKDEGAKLCLASEAISQHYDQKKVVANLCENEVRSNAAQYDFADASDSHEDDAWSHHSEYQESLVLYEDAMFSEVATLGSNIDELEQKSVLSCAENDASFDQEYDV